MKNFRKRRKLMTRNTKTEYMVQMALLIAVVIIMAFTPIGYIKALGLEIALIVIPVAVGAVFLGPKGGAVLGAAFGVTSLIRCFGLSAFTTTLFGLNPLAMVFTSLVPRILEGWLTGLIYQGLKKVKAKGAVLLSCLCCPILNTLFYMSCIVLFFYKTDYVQGFVETLHASNPITFVALFVGINGVVEILACGLIGTAVAKALIRVRH
jgi:uncharacterized membrane protein